MKNVFVRTIGAFGVVALMAGLGATAAPASAADCRYDQWGSSQWKGQKYKCRDGSSLYIKPPLGGNDWNSIPDNSWDRWRGTDSYGNGYNCTWDQWRSSWKCR